jgi:hypothetical protein
MNLDRVKRRLQLGLGEMQLRDGGFHRRLTASVFEVADPVDKRSGRVESHLHVGDAVGDGLNWLIGLPNW